MNIGLTAATLALAALNAPSGMAQDRIDLAPFVPPACVPGQEMFTDVPASNPFCPWIEQLARDHITGGCAPQLFCPTAPLTRAQMSVFLELAMRGTDTWIVDADLLDGMDSTEFVTGVSAGTGLTGGGSGGAPTLAVDVPYRLPQTCAGGQHPQWTGSAWGCGDPGTGTVTSVGTGTGLTGGPITTSGTISVAPGGITSALIADGTIAGADMAAGSVGSAQVNSAQVQLRVSPPCAAGEFVRAVNTDGTPVCAPDADSGGTVTSVATGAGLTGGPITGAGTISVAAGGITGAMIADGTVGSADVADGAIGSADVADGSIGAADVASAQVQLRVATPCAAGEFVRAINPDGTPVCAPDADSGGTVTSVATGAGLTGGPVTGSGTISVAAGGITGAMIADGTIAGPDVLDGSISSVDIFDGTIGAVDVNSAQVQRRVSQACSTSQFMRAVNVDGTVSCADQASHSHFGQDWQGSSASWGLLVYNAQGIGVFALSGSASGTAVRGQVDAGSGMTSGVVGAVASTEGTGVVGGASAGTGATKGVYGTSQSTSGTGVQGSVFATTGETVGVLGTSNSISGIGVRGEATFAVGGTDPTYGVEGINHRDLGAGVRGEGPTAGVQGTATETVNVATGVRGTSISAQGRGVLGEATATTGIALGVSGVSASISGRAVQGASTATTGTAYGVYGTAASSAGVGVRAAATATSGTNYGIIASTASASGYAGFFTGRVHVTSNLTVSGDLSVGGTKNFKIDHPLDPANRYLVHAAIESSEMLNMYSGTVVLDATGAATVRLPEWFEALNRDFRYQLTCIGGYAPVYVASEVRDGRFGIAGGRPGLKVSWQVVGARSDAHALAHPMAVEQDKPAEERGTYLDPEAHSQPAALGLDHRIGEAGREPGRN
jgi:hypothetical protein